VHAKIAHQRNADCHVQNQSPAHYSPKVDLIFSAKPAGQPQFS